MKFKVGDRVIYKPYKREGIIKRFCVSGFSNLIAESRYYYCASNVNEEAGEIFLETELELDRQYYRQEKIKQIIK